MIQKTRVYEVARELGVDPRELLGKINGLGIQVKNQMSSLDPVDIDRVKRALDKEKGSKVEEKLRGGTVVRRRTVAAPPAPKPPEPPVIAKEAPKPKPVEAPIAPVAERPRLAELPPPPESTPASMAEAFVAPLPPPEPIHETLDAKPAPKPEPRPEARVVPPSDVDERPEPVAEAKSAPPSEPPARRTQPPPASERFAHSILPPGVLSRGQSTAPSAPALSATTVQKIVADHAQRPGVAPAGGAYQRRQEITRAGLGAPGRAQPGKGMRPGKKQIMPGKKGAKTEITTPGAQKRVIRIEDQVGLQTLAQRMSLKATEVLMKLIQLGMTGVNINSTLDADTAKILASEFGYEVENVAKTEVDLISEARGTFEDTEKDRKTRAPVVTIMGHVDHGKTSLLDKIRAARVAEGEAGGITQHIGAYRVETAKGTIVFLDTPGHEAFTAMRARGGLAADVVILVVAADDGVMPQTKEAIAHARAAEVPIVVAMNKIDKPEARPEVVRRELSNEGLLSEEWGGDVMFREVSARTGQGIDELLDGVLLQAEVLELSANPKVPAEGLVLEARLDKGRGPVANVLVQNGTLSAGDIVVAGASWGKVRALTDDRGKSVQSAGPSTPVEVLGLSEVPGAGDALYVVTDAKKAQEIAASRRVPGGNKSLAPAPRASLEEIAERMKAGEVQDLRLVIKADVQGSVEAVVKALTDLTTEKVKVNVIHKDVGGITENDIMLASASSAIVIGFNVRPAGNAGALAKAEKVDVRLYSIIYEAVDEVKKAMTGLLAPTFVEKALGRAEVRKIFAIPKVGTVAGCYVLDGKILRSAKVRLVRDSVQIWEGTVLGLRRVKDDAREVAAGFECGISLQGYNDIKEQDIIECFEMEAVAAVL